VLWFGNITSTLLAGGCVLLEASDFCLKPKKREVSCCPLAVEVLGESRDAGMPSSLTPGKPEETHRWDAMEVGRARTHPLFLNCCVKG